MDAHHAEYAAAAAAIADQTPPGCRLPSVGDYVHGESAGRRWCGYVQQMEPGRAVIEADGAWLVVPPEHITSVEAGRKRENPWNGWVEAV